MHPVPVKTPTFDERYFQKRMFIAWSGRPIADALCAVLAPKTVLDVGCGTGHVARGFLDAGVEAWGVDNATAAGDCLPRGRYRARDLRLANWSGVPAPVDLVVCLEVFSVLAEEDKNDALQHLAELSDTLVVNHLGMKEQMWLALNGWDIDEEATRRLKHLLKPLSHKQAVKSLFRIGEVWRKVQPKEADGCG